MIEIQFRNIVNATYLPFHHACFQSSKSGELYKLTTELMASLIYIL